MMSPRSRLLYIVVMLSIAFYTGIVCSTCSTTATTINLPVLAMCTSSLGNGSRLVIDTFDSLSYGEDECVCAGTVKSITSESTKLTLSPLSILPSQTGESGCGSSIILQSSSTLSTSTSNCVLQSSIDVTNSDTITVKWKLNRKDNVLSKYCIYLQLENKDDFFLSMTCTPASEQSTTTIPTTTPTQKPLTTTTTATTKLRTTATITTGIINTQQISTALSDDSTIPGDNTTSENADNSVAIAVSVTVAVLVIILVSASVFVFINRRKADNHSNVIKEQLNAGKSAVPEVTYENTNPQNVRHTDMKEESAPTSSERLQSTGSQYTQLHVYSNDTNDEYSKLGPNNTCVKEDEDRNAYSEVTVDKVEYYNQQ